MKLGPISFSNMQFNVIPTTMKEQAVLFTHFGIILEIMDTTNHISITTYEISMCIYCSESQNFDEYALQAV